jgi:hypothetical protein
MLIYLDQIADKKLKAPSTSDAVTTEYASSTASIRTAGGMSVEKRLMVGQFYGRVPLGGVIPVVSTYTASNNGGGSPSDLSLLTPSSGQVTVDGFMRCDGVEIINPLSPFVGRYVPNISDDRFIQGSNTSSSLSGVNGANNGNNTVTLTINEMPNHNHGGSTNEAGNSSVSPGQYGLIRSNLNLPRTVDAFVNDSLGEPDIVTPPGAWNHSHGIASQGNAQSFDIRPKYISGIYLMRVI